MEEKVDLALDRTDQELQDIERHKKSLEKKITRVVRDGADTTWPDLRVMLEEASKRRYDQANKDGRQVEPHCRINDLYSDLRDSQYDLFTLFDQVFDESRLLPSSSAERFDIAEPHERSFGPQRGDSFLEPEHRNVHVDLNLSGQYPPDPVPKNNLGSGREPQQKHPSGDREGIGSLNGLIVSHAQPQSKDRRAELIYVFGTTRTMLHYAEQELENRSEYFDAQADARDRMITNGEDEETATEFDMRLLTETQRRTRRVLEAEESYEAAKAVLIDAGLRNRLGSELSSGFTDDPDDGYKLRFEQDM